MATSFDPNWQTFGLLLLYSAAVVVASVLGGMLPEWVRITHTRMQLMISFVGGLMLGIAIFHMIPHALVAAGGEVDQVTQGVMLGLVTTFFLIRIFHFHQHGPADFGMPMADDESLPSEDLSDFAHSPSTKPQPEAGCCHEHHHSQPAAQHSTARWIAVLVGLGLHTLTDGIAMASGVLTESAHQHSSFLPGFGIFLAVLLHKPLDAVSITSLMHPVSTASKRMLVNIGFALMCPVGALLFWSGASLDDFWAQELAAWGLAFSAGVFLCISLSDLLPEMEFHSHSRLPLSCALLLGIAVAWSIGLLEGEHAHSHAPSHGAIQEPHSAASAIGDDSSHSHEGHQH